MQGRVGVPGPDAAGLGLYYWKLSRRPRGAYARNPLRRFIEGRRAGFGGDDRTIKVWDLTDYKARTLNGHGHFVTGLAVLADGRLASASHDRTLKMRDAYLGGASRRSPATRTSSSASWPSSPAAASRRGPTTALQAQGPRVYDNKN